MNRILRKEKERIMREQYIIEIAQNLFLDKGIEKTTMDDIAAKSGLSKTTLYKYFKSKDELEILVYQKIHEVKMRYLVQQMEPHENAYKKLETFGFAYYAFFKKNPSYLQFQLKHDYIGINKKNIRKEIINNMIEFFNSDVEYLNSIFIQGVKEGSLRNDLDSAKTLDLFYLTLRAVLNQTLFFNPDTTMDSMFSDPEEKYNMILNIFLNGLKPQQEEK